MKSINACPKFGAERSLSYRYEWPNYYGPAGLPLSVAVQQAVCFGTTRIRCVMSAGMAHLRWFAEMPSIVLAVRVNPACRTR